MNQPARYWESPEVTAAKDAPVADLECRPKCWVQGLETLSIE